MRRGAGWRQGATELSSDAVREWLDALLSVEGTPRWSELTGGSVPVASPSAPAVILGAGDRRERAVLLDGPAAPEVRRDGEPLLLAMGSSIPAAGSWIARSSLTGGSSTSIPPPSRPSSSPTPRVPWSASRAARPSTTGG